MRGRDRIGRRRATLGLAATLAVGGCQGLLPGPQKPLRIYTLTPKTTYPEALPKVGWQLVVELPVAPAGINTNRIALTRTLTTIDYYADASWTDSAPEMVQNLLVESFETTGRILAVGRESVGLRADYVLKTELREFQAEYKSPDATPRAHVRLIGKLVRMPQREIVATTTAEEFAPASANTLNDVVDAFDEALGVVLKRMVVWALTAVPPEPRRV